MILTDRIREAEETSWKRNCIGTALFLTGCIPEDGFIKPEHFNLYLAHQLPRLKRPETGALMAFYLETDTHEQFQRVRKGTKHLAVISDTDPLGFLERKGYNEEVERNASWTDHQYQSLKTIMLKPKPVRNYGHLLEQGSATRSFLF